MESDWKNNNCINNFSGDSGYGQRYGIEINKVFI